MTSTATDPWTGVWLAEDIDTIRTGIQNGDWIDTSIGTATAGLDALAFLSDPLGSLLQYGVAWLIEHVRPLSEALDWLAGDPGQIAAQAQTWRDIASTLQDQAGDLDRAVRWDTVDWSGAAADAYRAWVGQRQTATTALASAAEMMAALVSGAGTLIAGVRTLVRDAIAVVVSRLIDYAVEEIFSLGVATPLVVEQATTLCASWAARIAHWLRALISSLDRLRGMADTMRQAVESIVAQIRRTAAEEEALNRVRKRGAGATQYFRIDVARSVADKYGIDLTGLDITLGDVKQRGVCGRTGRDGSIVLFSPGFRSEEDLARTLVHEKFHHDELAAGKRFPMNDEEFDLWEDRAYAYEEAWWENQPTRPEPRRK